MKNKLCRLVFSAVIGTAGAFTAQVNAVIISDNMTFATLNQSMWAEGATSTWSANTFLGKKWGTYNGTAAENAEIDLITGGISRDVCIGIPTPWGCGGARTDVDTRTGFAAGINSSGQIGLIPYAKASGGGIDVTLPVKATITLPDAITKNTVFKISTTGGSQAGAIISAKAPTFQAGVDGVFDSNNELYGMACFIAAGCAKDSLNVNLNAGQFKLLGFDTSKDKPLSAFGVEVPIKLFGKQFTIHTPTPSNPDGVDDDVTPQKEPSPVIGNIIFNNPEDKSGGVLNGDKLSLLTNQNIFEAKVSITGVIETLLGSPGVLRNDITIVDSPSPIPDIKANYTVADVSVGPVFGLQQQFDLDPRLMVQLEFDTPVTRMVTRVSEYNLEDFRGSFGSGITAGELQVRRNSDGTGDFCISLAIGGSPICGSIARPTGPQACFNIGVGPIQLENCIPTVASYETVAETHNNGVVDIMLGEMADLLFEGEIGQLVGRNYFLDDPLFRNDTAATVDPAIQIQLLCAGFTGLGDKCLYDETFQTTALASMSVYTNQWVLGGFNDFEYDDVYRLDSPDGPTNVPEPSILWLMLLGLGAFVVPSRRNKKVDDTSSAIT